MYKRKINMKLFKFWAKQFCLNTGLHGYKFIVLPRRILLERVFWVLVVSVSFIAAVVLLLLSKSSFDENPTTLVTDTIHHPIWNYPFPAVTLCSFNKISKERAQEQANLLPNKLNHSTSEIADLFALLSLLYFNNEVDVRNRAKLLRLIQILDRNKVDLTKLLRAVSPSCKDILIKCKWKEEERRCDTIFEKIITSEGHCCAFNYFAPKHHIFKGSYPAKAPKKPRHVSACGFQTSFEAIVDSNSADYFSTESLAYGIKVFIHSSYDYPDWSLQSYLVGMKLMALIGINPTKTYALPDVRAISAQKRQCYFKDEFALQNFEFYSYQNCLTECRMNIILKLCGCIPVVYVNEYDQSKSTRVCSLYDLECLQRNKLSDVPEWGVRPQVAGRSASASLQYAQVPHGTRVACALMTLGNQIKYDTTFLSHCILDAGNSLATMSDTDNVISAYLYLGFFAITALVKSSMPGVDLSLDNVTFNNVWDTQDYPCKCLPDCEFVDYVFEASQGELSRKFSNNNQRNLYGALQLINHSVIRIYFNDLIGTRNRRNVSHSWQTYLAFYGGILGLFVGFSFISVIEFVYFFAFKLLTDALKRLKPEKNLKKESVKVAEAFENPMKSTRRLRHREFIRQNDEAPQWFMH